MDSALPRADWRLPQARLFAGAWLGAYLGSVASLVLEQRALWLSLAFLLLLVAAWASRGHRTRWFLGLCAATLLMPPLPLGWGNTGPHPALLFAALGLWEGFKHIHEWRVPKTPLTLSIGLFALLLSVSVAPAWFYSGWTVAAGSLARVLLFGVGVFAFLSFAYGPASRGSDSPLLWARWLYVMGVAVALYACIDFYFQFTPLTGYSAQFVWLPGSVLRRAQAFFYDATVLGNLCAFFLIFTVLAWLRPGLRHHLISPGWLLGGGLILATALILSFSRSALLAFCGSLIPLLYLERRRLQMARLIVGGLVLAGGGLLLTYLFFPAFVESYVLRLWATVTGVLYSPETLLSGRWQSWQTLLDYLATHPWVLITGIGFKTLPHTDLVSAPMVADNMYLSILVETGILGFLAMLSMLAAMLHAGWRVARDSDQTRSFLGVWVLCFWVGQLFQLFWVDALTYWRVLPIYFFVLALAVHGREVAPRVRECDG